MSAFTKLYLKRQMSLEEEINLNGFLFKNLDIPENIKKEALAFSEPTTSVVSFFLNYLKRLDPMIKNIHCVYEDIKFGMFHEMHTHLTPSRYQVLAWFPRSDYDGREFIYGEKNNLKKIKPTSDLLCFMKTNDIKYIHGVEPLKNDTLVRTLIMSVDHVTMMGDHLTISLDMKDI